MDYIVTAVAGVCVLGVLLFLISCGGAIDEEHERVIRHGR